MIQISFARQKDSYSSDFVYIILYFAKVFSICTVKDAKYTFKNNIMANLTNILVNAKFSPCQSNWISIE